MRSAGRGDHPDAAPAAARGGLEHQGVADLAHPRAARRPGWRRHRRLHGATGTPACSAISLAPILSPSLRIASALGPTNVTPVFSHSSANAGSSATKPQPTQAASAPRLQQGLLQHGEVEVGAGRGRAQRVGQVGLPDERRRPVRVGVEGDGLDPGPGFRGEVPDGMDQPHGGLSAVHDGDTTEQGLSLPCACARQATSDLRSVAYTLPSFRRVHQCRACPTPGRLRCGNQPKRAAQAAAWLSPGHQGR